MIILTFDDINFPRSHWKSRSRLLSQGLFIFGFLCLIVVRAGVFGGWLCKSARILWECSFLEVVSHAVAIDLWVGCGAWTYFVLVAPFIRSVVDGNFHCVFDCFTKMLLRDAVTLLRSQWARTLCQVYRVVVTWAWRAFPRFVTHLSLLTRNSSQTIP